MGNNMQRDGQFNHTADFASLASDWAQVVASGFLTALRPATLTDQQIATIRSDQDGLLEEARGTVSRWCDRRFRSLQSTIALMDRLAQPGNGSGATGALIDWYAASLTRMSEDISDQIELASKALNVLQVGVPESWPVVGTSALGRNGMMFSE
jgi:hypothetical protein